MRDDAFGLFWEDMPTGRGRNKVRPIPAIPESTWQPPREFPNLSAATLIAVDCETWDPELEDHGPGWARGVGHIVGVSIAAVDDHGNYGKWYFPIRHEMQPELNMDSAKVLAWLRDTLSNPHQPKVGANITYDIGWLAHEGVQVAGWLLDVQFAEALLTEGAPVALEALGQKYLGEGKESPELYKWCALAYGGKETGWQRRNIHRAPVTLTGPYAESDADLPLRLWPVLRRAMELDGVLDVFWLECRLIRLMVAMRFKGVSVDVVKAEQLREQLIAGEVQAQAALDAIAGFPCNANSGDDLARACAANGVQHPTTAKGAPSFRKEWLSNLEHPLGEHIQQVRLMQKMRGTFVEGYILNGHVNGVVYGSFHQMRSDDGGTRSGRFSSSAPNLQNIPSRDPVWGPAIRGLFVPDLGDAYWTKGDYSQIEYRFLAHFAVGPSAEALRARYAADPSTDYHVATQGMVADFSGREIDRKPIKNINFGLIYGMGVAKLARGLGMSEAEGRALFDIYHLAAPYAKATMDECSSEAQRTGLITTVLGRKSRFELWEPSGFKKGAALPYRAAIAKYKAIERAMTHKALNRRLQGSAADQMKKAMADCWDAGLFEDSTVPRLTVHDELNWSSTGAPEETEKFREINHVMETCIPMRVPVLFDWERGTDWGHVAAWDFL